MLQIDCKPNYAMNTTSNRVSSAVRYLGSRYLRSSAMTSLQTAANVPHIACSIASQAAMYSTTGEHGSWEGMLDILSSLIKHKTRADGENWRDAHENMPVYLKRLGMDESVQKLNVIHVAGTKGKGSTCAMVESILRSAGYSTGLFTSPHLCDVRERVRINGQMVSKAVFTDAFWRCYNTLQAAATDEVGMPGYFRFLTLLGLQIFIDAQPDVVILEVGIGGRIDATNIIHKPAVTGITSLGFDHMELLGHTLDLIAREKAGIMRRSVPCFTVVQPSEAMDALHACASAAGTAVQIAPSLTSFQPAAPGGEISVGLAGEHQWLNASLAVALVRSWEQHRVNSSSNSNKDDVDHHQQQQQQQQGSTWRLQQLQEGVLPLEYCDGLKQAAWPGRSQVVPHPKFQAPGSGSSPSRLTLYLDGAHTPESMLTCAAWFAHVTAADADKLQQQQQQKQQQQQQVEGSSSGSSVTAAQQEQQQQQQPQQVVRVLIFNCMKERDPAVLLPHLHSELQKHGAEVHVALFVPPDSQYAFLPTSTTKELVAVAHQDLSWQQQLQGVWQQCQATAAAAVAADTGCTSGKELLPQLPDVPGIGPQGVSSGSAVLSSVGQALSWLEAAAAAAPQLQLQVLVTGSLYLVGDCLMSLQQQPK